jgi:hypothetical protein
VRNEVHITDYDYVVMQLHAVRRKPDEVKKDALGIQHQLYGVPIILLKCRTGSNI